MTTIILVSIGILLALVATLAVIFWGGSGFQDGKTKAEAGRLVSESVQMEHAVDMFERVEGYEPGNGQSGTPASQDLLTKKYMTNIPPGAVTNSAGDPSSWTVDYDNKMIYSDLGTDANATKICVMARRQLQRPNPEQIPACTPTLGENEPCCTKSS